MPIPRANTNTPAPLPRPLTEVERHEFNGALTVLDKVGQHIADHPEFTRADILNDLAELYVSVLCRTLVQ